ncbi:MAG: hypothetical protein K1X53_15920 [Candidatus Sumerlaeaceae bacterium]|nr:hypothetical protein [Candidatus Sumerlaeaceae bacterium]
MRDLTTLPVCDPSQHSFDTIVGHDLAKSYLMRAYDAQVLPHALLFHGPRGLGKLSMAYALAKHVNAPSPSDLVQSEIRRKISDQVFADLLVVEPKGAAGQITLNGWKPGKDDPDGLQYYRFVDSRPLEGSKKFLIFRRADRMNVALANFLLKLIEEPPSYLQVVLVTDRPNDLLVTIRSRCAPVKFSPLMASEMDAFARIAMPDALTHERQALVQLADGRPGMLRELLDSDTANLRGDVVKLMRKFQQFGFLSLFRVASELANSTGKPTRGGASSESFESVLNALQAWLRDATISKALPPDLATRLFVNGPEAAEISGYAKDTSLEALAGAVETLRRSYHYIPRQTDRNYVLELLLLRLGRAMKS